jgi:patatin-like phospholipase
MPRLEGESLTAWKKNGLHPVHRTRSGKELSNERVRTTHGPKRLLALDGGGIRGAITLGFLEQMERLRRARHKREDLDLCDYFDLIGGTGKWVRS